MRAHTGIVFAAIIFSIIAVVISIFAFSDSFSTMVAALRDEWNSRTNCIYENDASRPIGMSDIHVTEVAVECYESRSAVLFPSYRGFDLYLSHNALRSGSDGQPLNAERIARSHAHIEFDMRNGVLEIRLPEDKLVTYRNNSELIAGWNLLSVHGRGKQE